MDHPNLKLFHREVFNKFETPFGEVVKEVFIFQIE